MVTLVIQTIKVMSEPVFQRLFQKGQELFLTFVEAYIPDQGPPKIDDDSTMQPLHERQWQSVSASNRSKDDIQNPFSSLILLKMVFYPFITKLCNKYTLKI